MRKYNIKPIKGVWINFPNDDVEIKVKPVSVFSLKKIPSEQDTLTIEDGWSLFNGMVMDWKGIVDEGDNPIKCNEESKKIVYEFDQELVSFVIEECNKLREDFIGSEKSRKNSKTSQPGEDQKKEK